MYFDVTMTVQLNMRIDAFDKREAMDIVINQCYAPLCEQISECDVTVLSEEAVPVIEEAL